MHIEEIILDGFKSYPCKTVIGPFHPQFNAITGLNGSGKSNVLDAICFVMGINNINLIRVNRLDELIYKQGQAGITKSSVTIKFNNERKPSPLHEPYKSMKHITITRQIVVGGRNRYLLNSHNAKPKDIADFFQTLKLNINNPHFLIMQGKITKVINMKPLEILGLIEECSGTKLYEIKRANALKLMDKKDIKLKEIDKILATEIEPALAKLRKEKSEYNNFVNNVEEIEKFEKMEIAYRYLIAKKKMVEAQTKVNKIESQFKELKEQIDEIENKLLKCIKRKEEATNEYHVANKPLMQLEEKIQKLQAELAGIFSSFNEKGRDIEREIKRKKQLTETITKSEKELTDIEKKLEKAKGATTFIDTYTTTIEDLKRELMDKELLISSTGGESKENVEGTLRDQLKKYKSDLSKLDTDIHNILHNNKQLEKEIMTLKDQKKKMGLDDTELQEEKQEEEKKKKECEKELEKIHKEYKNVENYEELQKEKNKLNGEVEQLKREISVLNAMITHIRIDYKIPPTMKPTDVIGQLYELLKIKKEYDHTKLAVHLILGGKLAYILVNNKDNCKTLFEHNDFANGKKRVTLLPLEDCIIARDLNQKQVEECRVSMGFDKKDPNNIIHFLDIMDYEKKLEKMVKYAFSGTLICADSELCRKITYNKNKKNAHPTISLEGDKFDTSGCMSGGSVKNMNYLLENYEKYVIKKKEQQEKENVFIKLKEEVEKLAEAHEKIKRIMKELNMHDNNLKNINNRLSASEGGNMNLKIAQVQEKLDSGRNEIANLYNEQKKLNDHICKIEKDVKDFELDKTRKENELKKSVETLKKKIKDTENEKLEKEMQVSKLLEQMEEAKKNLEDSRNALKEVEDILNDYNERKQGVDTRSKSITENIQTLEVEKSALQANTSVYEEELNGLEKTIVGLEKEKENKKIDISKIENDLGEAQVSVKIATNAVKELNKTYLWIESQEELFNKEDGPYDFRNLRYEEVQEKLSELKTAQQKLSGSVNRKAIRMFDSVEKDYADLITKKKQVEQDRKKIKEVIADLDVRKKESLHAMYKQVNENFEAIFSSLLHGAQAKLDVINGELSNGVEMKIAFSNKWKESLTELSGGQRSLLALSLILALLKVRTVPMYILDEIDAALDLSHTENIGDMIRTQFPQSQFIIVSLKEGMFTHADVLFKMRFCDGVSAVSRHALDVRDVSKNKSADADKKEGDGKKGQEKKKRRISSNKKESDEDND